MSEYVYEAVDPTGKLRHGTVSAESPAGAAAALRRQGIIPVSVRRKEDAAPLRRRLLMLETATSSAWRLSAVRQLAALVKAGIPLDRALDLMAGQSGKAGQGTVLKSALSGLIAGHSLSSSLQNSGAGFQSDEIGIIAAGEQAGDLARALADLTLILERRAKTRSELLSALVYPAFLLTLAPASLLIIAFVLVPNIAPLFDNNNAAMPFTLRAMVAVTGAIDRSPAAVVLTLLALAGTSALVLRRMKWRSLALAVVSHVPGLSSISRNAEASRICGVLASLLRGGASLQVAMGHCAAAALGEDTRAALLSARDAVQTGVKLSRALDSVTVIDSAARQMIAVGEETNALEAMLGHIADSKGQESERAMARLLTLLTPVLTIMMGVLVGGIVMSIMQAILKVNELAVQ